MAYRQIRLHPEQDARFGAYGVIFGTEPDGSRLRVPLGDALDPHRGHFTATIIRVRAAMSLAPIGRIERHPYSVQAFVPLGACGLVALVAPVGEPPADPEEITLFYIPAGCGIAYRPGVWHAGLMGERIDAAVLSLIRRVDDGTDTELFDLPFSIDLGRMPLNGR